MQSEKKRPKQNHRSKKRRPNRRNKVRLILLIVCAAVFLYSGIRLTLWALDARDTDQANTELQKLHTEAEEVTSPLVGREPIAPTEAPKPTYPPLEPGDFQYVGEVKEELADLLARNADLVGWIDIPDVVDLPVMYRDNEYYLTHDFYDREKRSGALFLDENHPFTARTQHLLIHGHNMKDGSMFGMLNQYEKQSFGQSHGVINFSTLYRDEKYLLLAVSVVSTDPSAENYFFYAGTPVFLGEEALRAFMENVERTALYRTPIDVGIDDALMTLSTCLDDDRLLVVCRRMRDDETQESVLAKLQQ